MEETAKPCEFDKLFTRSVPHILEKIFFSLDYTSLKASSGVCKSWNELMATKVYQKKLLEVKKKETDLLISSMKGDPERVQQLLSSGTDPNCTQKYASKDGIHYVWHEDTPLHLAARTQGSLLDQYKDVIQLLLNAGADTNKVDGYGETPLTKLLLQANYYKPGEAAMLGHSDVVKALLEGGADPNKVNERGEAPIQIATRYGNLHVFQILINAGAEPKYRS